MSDEDCMIDVFGKLAVDLEACYFPANNRAVVAVAIDSGKLICGK